MGDINQIIFLKNANLTINGPVLEVGSKDYGSTSSFRDHFPQTEYTGLDLEEGKNVDVILDLCEGVGALKKNHYDLIICCSVFEHMKKPWLAAQNMMDLLKSGGHVYISVPWVWRYHAYPDDYFRFSKSGVESLFDGIHWLKAHYSTNVPGEFYDINQHKYKDNEMAMIKNLQEDLKRKYLPYLMVNMLGQKS